MYNDSKTATLTRSNALSQSAPPKKQFLSSGRLQIILLVTAVLVLPIIFASFNPMFVAPQNLNSLMRQASVLLLVAAAGTVPILVGSIDLSVGAIVSLSAVSAALFAQELGQWAVFLAIPVGALLGLVNGIICAYVRLPSFLVTLGTSFAYAGIALLLSGGFPVPLASGPLNTAFRNSIFGVIPLPLVYALILWFLLILFLRRTATGRYVYAVGGNEKSAKLSGIRVAWVKTIAFTASGILCSAGGILLLFSTTAASVDIGNSYLLPSIAAIVMGGTALSGGQGGAARGLVGVFILVQLTNGMYILGFPPASQQIIQGLVVILSVFLTFERSRSLIVK